MEGVGLGGATFVDESMLTRGPIHVEKGSGANVVDGAENRASAFSCAAARVGEETVLAQIVRTVEQPEASKPPIQSVADRIASTFVPIVLVVAVVPFGA